MDDPEDDDMGCGAWDSHDSNCNILHPCEECCNAPTHKFVGNMDRDCEECGMSIYMPCHDVAP